MKVDTVNSRRKDVDYQEQGRLLLLDPLQAVSHLVLIERSFHRAPRFLDSLLVSESEARRIDFGLDIPKSSCAARQAFLDRFQLVVLGYGYEILIEQTSLDLGQRDVQRV